MRSPNQSRLGLRSIPIVAFGVTILLTLGTAPAEEAAGVSLELNKLEPQDRGCRVYMVATNKSPTTFQTLKLDLVLFQPDGVIGRRLAIDLGPLKPAKRTVKLFDLDMVPCDQLGSLLINDVLECKTEAGSSSDCLSKLTTSSLTKTQLTK